MAERAVQLVVLQGHLPGGQPTSAWTFPVDMAGVGGVRATLDDMVRYAQAQLGQVDAPVAAALVRTQQRSARWLSLAGGALGVALAYLGLHVLLGSWLGVPPVPPMKALWVGVALAFGLLFALQSAITYLDIAKELNATTNEWRLTRMGQLMVGNALHYADDLQTATTRMQQKAAGIKLIRDNAKNLQRLGMTADQAKRWLGAK